MKKTITTILLLTTIGIAIGETLEKAPINLKKGTEPTINQKLSEKHNTTIYEKKGIQIIKENNHTIITTNAEKVIKEGELSI